MNWNSIKLALPLLLAVACAKEAPPAEPGRSASLTVRLPETGTKTALGVKTGNKYPVLWQEGDCLQLNGYSSLPLAAQAAGGSSAGFVFRDGLSAPYNLLYPVSGESDLVVFPATQQYVAGGFDPAAVPMWGTSATYEGVSLKHLFSLLRISVSTGVPRVLKGITVTALGGEPISGSFRMGVDESGAFDGSLQADSGAPSVYYSFGEGGLSLSAGQTVDAYVSIPVGTYSAGFKAVVMSAACEYRMLRFFSAGRDVLPGKVLEFPPKTFEDCTVIWEYYVSASGTGDGLSEENPMSVASMLTLLQDTESDRLNDATFHFSPGTHSITAPIVLPGKDTYIHPSNYTITGDNQSTLDGGGASQIFLVTADNSHVTIKDIVLTHGSSTESGGLVSVAESGPLFEHCVFSNTSTAGSGGAVRISTDSKGYGRFKDCAFSGNVSSGPGGGAVVITNPRTTGVFSGCTFSGNEATASGGAVYSTNGTLTLEHCVLDGNKAANGGALCSTAGTIRIDGGRISNNTATSEGGAVYSADKQKPVFYINGCSIVDNTASKNGYVMYLNTATASNFATLCLNNTTVYNSKAMETTNASAICNKGKTLILNSTLQASTSKWGTFALGCHKNFEDPYGCLLLNSIFVNTVSGKPAIYQTGSNYYCIAKNCIASSVVDNDQFTQNNVIKESPALTWNGSLFTWDGFSTLPHLTVHDIETELSGETYKIAAGFLTWLKSIKYNIGGTEYNALDVDQTGKLRSEYSWAGAYQK